VGARLVIESVGRLVCPPPPPPGIDSANVLVGANVRGTTATGVGRNDLDPRGICRPLRVVVRSPSPPRRFNPVDTKPGIGRKLAARLAMPKIFLCRNPR